MRSMKLKPVPAYKARRRWRERAAWVAMHELCACAPTQATQNLGVLGTPERWCAVSRGAAGGVR